MRFCSFFCLAFLLFSQHLMAESNSTPIFLDELEDEQNSKQKVVQRVLPNPNLDRLTAVIDNLKDAEVVNIAFADNSEQSFIGIFKKAMAKKARGNILILPGDGLYPTRLNNLIEQMSRVGWNALSLSLNDYPRADILAPRTLPAVKIFAKMPKKTTEDSPKNANAEEDFKVADLDPPPSSIALSNSSFATEDEEEKNPALPSKRPIQEIQAEYAKNIENRLNAALQWLKTNTGETTKTVLVLHRESAYWLSGELIDNVLPKSMPIVFLNVVAPKARDIYALSKNIEKLDKRPILDIYDPTNIREKKLAELRFAAYKRADNTLAIQTRKFSEGDPSQNGLEKWFSQRISAWIRSLDKHTKR